MIVFGKIGNSYKIRRVITFSYIVGEKNETYKEYFKVSLYFWNYYILSNFAVY